MKLERASLAQVKMGRDGRTITVEQDTLDVVGQIEELDPRLSVEWNERGEFFTVIETGPDGTEHLVTTAQELDQRLVEHLRRIGAADYDLVKEAERVDREADKARDQQFAERVGESGERLHHALRKDLQVQDRVYVSR